ncbi:MULTISPECIES: PucR family transcriptional regulator [Amycolatopsis]|uniref:PucR family transcriptional regulator n=1 Tax=Amycolatopsis TaxID=1813 RepID=UPI000B8B4443|nr:MULTISPECIES: PucR family transcriptional regulator [Amycolatopsis]OXM73721.1 Fis family transcriptional regulator [Amycolatopsis sp. KNN50.9b]
MVTVGDLVAVASLNLVPAHLADASAVLRWAATSELPDPTPFLEGGEVLLTTGLQTAEWDQEWSRYVDRLIAARVAAIGFGTGLTHEALPAGLVAACRDQGMNLVEVPRATTFVAISHTVASLLESAADAQARAQLDAQRRLTQAALLHDTPTHLVATLAEVLDGAATLLGPDAVPLTGPRCDKVDVAVVHAEVERLRPSGRRAAATVQTRAGTLVVQPIGISGRPSSHLAVQVPGRLGDTERTTVAAAVALLGLTAETRRERRDQVRRLRVRALELLVQGDVRSAAIVLDAAGDPPGLVPPRVVVARASGGADAVEEGLSVLDRAGDFAAPVEDELWLLAPPARIDSAVAALTGLGLLVGVGDTVAVTDVRRSVANAGHALATASPAAPVVRWSTVVDEGALTVLDPERATAFARSFLSRLGEDPDLLETLSSFLRHNGSRLKVAQELAVHRNTVGNRIDQIERALGASLDAPQTRVSAWIAVQVATEWAR